MKSYKQLTESIRNRLNPESYRLEQSFSDELGTISYSDALVYVRLAMKGVDPAYTQVSKDAGEKVKQHLDQELTDKTFKYQGSVMTNTHIKGYSDIDLLVISDKFYSYDATKVNEILSNSDRKSKFLNESIVKLEKEKSSNSYAGNALDDLASLRSKSEQKLSNVYQECDTTKAKAIKIKNLGLNREVDVVIANWYDDVTSIINNKGEYRGIQVYDKIANRKGNADFPFLSIERINGRSSETNGRLKKMIRFLKNIKAHSDNEIKLSSFDINAICYDIETNKYKELPFYDLVTVIYNQLASISTDKTHSDRLVSVDSREYIFKYNSKKLENVKIIMNEVASVVADLKTVPLYG